MNKKLFVLLKLLPIAFLAVGIVGVCVGYWNRNVPLLV
jgi:hypothetical protein